MSPPIHHTKHEQVNQEKKWADVGRLMGYGGIPNLSTQLRNSYIRVILPYEHYSESVKNSATMSPAKKKDTKTPIPNSAGLESGSHISPLSSPSMSTSSLSDLPDDEEGHTKKHVTHNGSSEYYIGYFSLVVWTQSNVSV